MKLIKLVFTVACALNVAGCTTTQRVSASKGKIEQGARSIIGTALIGVRGATPADQDGIEDTVAGICAARVWTTAECARHDEAVK